MNSRLIKKYLNNNQEGFTLVELIVVVVIIGILSAIAIPSFQNASKKARQKGVSAQISTYVKAAQAFYSEYSLPVRNAGNLGEFTDVIECMYHLINKCKGQTNFHRNMVISAPAATAWNSTSGMYSIRMQRSDNSRFRLVALPQRQDSQSSVLSTEDYGVSGCFNYNTGATKVVSWSQIGYRAVKDLNC